MNTDPRHIAAQGFEGTGERLPFFDHIQRSFGRHDVSGIRAHVGGAAGRAARQLGARAFAFGDRVAFDGGPDLHTAAHEAAHHIQQRAGIALKGNLDQPGDEYEAHADEVADAVVRGASAESLLDRMAGRGASASPGAPTMVQRKTSAGARGGAVATPAVVHHDGARWPVFAQNGLPYLVARRDGAPGFWAVRDWVASGEGVAKSKGAITSPQRTREILLAMGWVPSPSLEYAARTLTFQFGGAMVQHFQIGAQAAFAMGLPNGREAIVERGDAQGLRATVALDDASIPAGARHALTPRERQRALQAAADYTGLATQPDGRSFLMTKWIVPDRQVGAGVLYLELNRAVCRTLFGQAAYDAWLGGKVPRLRKEEANGPKLKLENYYQRPIPGRITHHGDIVEATEALRLEVEVAWPRAFPDPAIYDAPPMVTGSKFGTVALLACSWTFVRIDGAAGGPTPKGWTRTASTTDAETVQKFELGADEAQGTFRVTCAARFDAYFAPATFTRDIVVLSSRAAMSKLQKEAFAGLGTSSAERTHGAWHADTAPGFKATPAVGSSENVDDPMARDRALQRDRLRAVADYLRAQSSAHEAVEALERELARQEASEKLLVGDRAKGWQPFQLRGTYLSRTEGLASGPLDLHGTVHVELAQDPHRNSDEMPRVGPTYDKVVVQIRDLSRRFEQSDFVFRGEGRSFESALHDAFDDLAVAYPKGLVSIEAEEIRDTALRRGSGQSGPDASLGTATGKVFGFQRSTDSTWKSIKQAVWDPVVSFAVNLGAIALMTFVPPSAPIVTPALIAYNSIPAVDRIATEANRGTLTLGTFVMSTGEIALNMLPMVARARPFTPGWYAVETANWGGQLALMTAEAVQAARGLQATHIKALADEYQQYLELQKTSLPSDPGLANAKEAIREHAAEVESEISQQFIELAKGNLVQMVAGSVVHNTSVRAHEAIIEHLEGAHGSAVLAQTADPPARADRATDASASAAPTDGSVHVAPAARSSSSQHEKDALPGTEPWGVGSVAQEHPAPAAAHEARSARPPVSNAERDSSLAMIDEGARNKALAEQHAHEQGSVPIGKVLDVLAEDDDLTREARQRQIDLLEELIQQATRKGQHTATVTDLSPAATHVEDGVVKAPKKVVIASIEGDLRTGLLNQILRSKRELLKRGPGSKEFGLAQAAVSKAVASYRNALTMKKPEYARYDATVNTGQEFFVRYGMLLEHGLSSSEIAQQRASAPQLGMQELRYSPKGKSLAQVRTDAAHLLANRPEDADVSLTYAPTKGRTSDVEQRLTVAYVKAWYDDPKLQRMFNGIDSAGTESATHPPATRWEASAQRTFRNAIVMREHLATQLRTPSDAQALAHRVARITGETLALAETRIERYRAERYEAALEATELRAARLRSSGPRAVGASPALPALDPKTGQLIERFAGLSLEEVAGDTRLVTEALNAWSAETGSKHAEVTLFGDTYHAGEQLLNDKVTPFVLLDQVDQAVSLGADRIGHALVLGVTPDVLIRVGRLLPEERTTFAARQRQVIEHVRARGVVIEANLSSNQEISNLTHGEHPAGRFVEEGLRVTVNTDDETILGTDIRSELEKVSRAPGVRRADLAAMMLESYRSRLGNRELAHRERIKPALARALQTGLSPTETNALATHLARYFHITPARSPSATIQRVLDTALGL